jgi:hypothetical protein
MCVYIARTEGEGGKYRGQWWREASPSLYLSSSSSSQEAFRVANKIKTGHRERKYKIVGLSLRN